MEFLIASIAGMVSGLCASLGLGGGSILLLYLTLFAGTAQLTAQGINLLFFIPCSALALVGHFRSGLIEKKIVLKFILFGLAGAAGGFLLAGILGGELLRKAFGGFLIIIGIMSFFNKKK